MTISLYVSFKSFIFQNIFGIIAVSLYTIRNTLLNLNGIYNKVYDLSDAIGNLLHNDSKLRDIKKTSSLLAALQKARKIKRVINLRFFKKLAFCPWSASAPLVICNDGGGAFGTVVNFFQDLKIRQFASIHEGWSWPHLPS